MLLLGANIDAGQIGELGRQAAVVVVGGQFTSSQVSSVHPSEASGVQQFMDYLVEIEHRGIVHIDGGVKTSSANDARPNRGW
ncbi:hypothetical protein ACWEKM_33920 [Streptomyces sp. NPDC004752]